MLNQPIEGDDCRYPRHHPSRRDEDTVGTTTYVILPGTSVKENHSTRACKQPLPDNVVTQIMRMKPNKKVEYLPLTCHGEQRRTSYQEWLSSRLRKRFSDDHGGQLLPAGGHRTRSKIAGHQRAGRPHVRRLAS